MGIKGAILGDIAGSRFEFLTKQERIDTIDVLGENYNLFDKEKCFCTDDSICSVAIMDTILNGRKFLGRYPFEQYLIKHCNKYPGAGYGTMFQAWLENKKKQPYNSFGNGSAMRVSFIGEYFRRECDVERYAAMSSQITHNHKEGIKGAVVTAKCVWLAKNGSSKLEILKYLAKEYSSKYYVYGANRSIFDYYDNYKWSGSAQDSVPVAIRAFVDTDSFEEMMYLINLMDCDSDTLGAIGGAVAESFYGSVTENDLGLIQEFIWPELYEILIQK